MKMLQAQEKYNFLKLEELSFHRVAEPLLENQEEEKKTLHLFQNYKNNYSWSYFVTAFGDRMGFWRGKAFRGRWNILAQIFQSLRSKAFRWWCWCWWRCYVGTPCALYTILYLMTDVSALLWNGSVESRWLTDREEAGEGWHIISHFHLWFRNYKIIFQINFYMKHNTVASQWTSTHQDW